jgi:hypothetical protein
MITTCKCCREEVEVNMFFYNRKILSTRLMPDDLEDYRAVVRGRAICPCCGAEINEEFSSLISRRDIVRLAIGKGGGE